MYNVLLTLSAVTVGFSVTCQFHLRGIFDAATRFVTEHSDGIFTHKYTLFSLCFNQKSQSEEGSWAQVRGNPSVAVSFH